MSTPDIEAIYVNEFRDGCCYEESCPPVIPPLHSSGDAKIGKEERHGRFGEMILWNDVRMLVFKMVESERVDAPAGPLTVVAFLAAVTMVVLRVMLEASTQHAPE